MHVCLSSHICSDMVKGVRRLSRSCSYAFESNTDSWEGLCQSSQRRADVVRVKCVLMGSFVVFVGSIVCSGQG